MHQEQEDVEMLRCCFMHLDEDLHEGPPSVRLMKGRRMTVNTDERDGGRTSKRK